MSHFHLRNILNDKTNIFQVGNDKHIIRHVVWKQLQLACKLWQWVKYARANHFILANNGLAHKRPHAMFWQDIICSLLSLNFWTNLGNQKFRAYFTPSATHQNKTGKQVWFLFHGENISISLYVECIRFHGKIPMLYFDKYESLEKIAFINVYVLIYRISMTSSTDEKT